MSRQAPGGYAFVLNLFDAEPVFHSWKRLGENGRTNSTTDCGLDPRSPHVHNAVTIPEQHAVKFARPCRRCYPPGAKVSP